MKKGIFFYLSFILSSKRSRYQKIASDERSFMDTGEKYL